MSSRSALFRTLLTQRVLVADGARSTMLRAAPPSVDDAIVVHPEVTYFNAT